MWTAARLTGCASLVDGLEDQGPVERGSSRCLYVTKFTVALIGLLRHHVPIYLFIYLFKKHSRGANSPFFEYFVGFPQVRLMRNTTNT